MKPISAGAILTALVVLAPLVNANEDAGQRVVRLSYDGCKGFGTFIPADADTLRRHVPRGFAMDGEATGTVVLGAVFVHCATVSIEGVPAAAMNYAVFFAELESHEGSYDILEVTDSKPWRNAMQYVGRTHELAESMAVDFTYPTPGHPVGFAYVEYTGGTIRATSVPAAAVNFELEDMPSHHWNVGKHGMVYAFHDNTVHGTGPAIITVEASAGSLAAQLMGAETRTSGGLHLEYGAPAVYTAHGK